MQNQVLRHPGQTQMLALKRVIVMKRRLMRQGYTWLPDGMDSPMCFYGKVNTTVHPYRCKIQNYIESS